MKTVKKHPFNSQITALELGYGIIGRPLMNVYCYLTGKRNRPEIGSPAGPVR